MRGGRCATSPRLIFFLGGVAFSTDRFRPKGLKEMRAKPLVLAKHRMAEEMCNLSEVDFFWGFDVFYRAIQA